MAFRTQCPFTGRTQRAPDFMLATWASSHLLHQVFRGCWCGAQTEETPVRGAVCCRASGRSYSHNTIRRSCLNRGEVRCLGLWARSRGPYHLKALAHHTCSCTNGGRGGTTQSEGPDTLRRSMKCQRRHEVKMQNLTGGVGGGWGVYV